MGNRSILSSLWRNDDHVSDETGDHSRARSDETTTTTSSIDTSSSSSSLMAKLRSQPLDTSSILYPTLTLHPSPIHHNILVLSLSHVSNAPPTLSNDELFNVLLKRLEPWVGEEGEGGYVLIVLADEDHSGKEKEKRNLPGIAWWVWRWKRLPRKYRKNLKRLYIVRPSLFTRTLLPFIIPFISPKSYSKLHPLPSLLSLYHAHKVPLKGIDISLSVVEAESRVLKERPDIIPPTPPTRGKNVGTEAVPTLKRIDSESSLASWGYQTISSAMETAASYLPIPHFGLGSYDNQQSPLVSGNKGYWGRDLDDLIRAAEGNVNGGIPSLLVDLGKAILQECIRTEGVFRRTSNSHLVPTLIAILDVPISQQPNLPWPEIAKEDPLLPPKILSRFLGDMKEPILTNSVYDLIRRTRTIEDIKTRFIPSLSSSTSLLLNYLIDLLHQLSLYCETTRMNSLNLAIVIAPVLIHGPDPIEDTILCLEPSKPIPPGLRKMAEINGLNLATEEGVDEGQRSNTLVGMLDMWIKDYPIS
ncbi:hypothetical protein L486_02478 [Kwoniella mangroviensis CBS 10435]|uniref:Rho-GAP domain-containing protein n=1 Tax=Kwoniella mangroviensis CBS 10435 TaxID=1331196 RepID=A0A1B9IW90_9TREE|nr:hypothetical protein L486_02478 [Kwoniella mangroviensis CBS 10435]